MTLKLSNHFTLCYWYRFLENVIIQFKNERYKFNHIAEMHILKTTIKLDLSYDFYIKFNICALE